MLGASEFISQIIPLFVQLIGIPVVLGAGYFGYQYYKKQQSPPEPAQTEATPSIVTRSEPKPEPTIDDVFPDDLTPVIQTEDDKMTDNNQPDMPEEDNSVSQPKQIDTSDLPPLDLLLGNLEDDEEEPEPEPEPIPEPEAPPQVVQLRKTSPDIEYLQLNSGQIAPAQEILTILRDEDDGRLMIQVGNTAYRTLADTPEIKQLFTQIMKELAGTIVKPDENPPQRRRYVVGEPPKQPKTSLKPKQKSAQTDMPSIRDLLANNDPKPANPKPKASIPPPPPAKDAPMPGDLPSFKLDDNPLKTEKKGRFGQKTEAEPVPELDLAAAIETYLQYKLQHTPEYRGRKIHIHGTPSGAIRIQVDENYYDFVDEVEDVDVRQFLQETIAEWQERQ